MGSIEPPKETFHVAIVGAGIGGLALAIGLLKQNVPYTLYEAASCYSMVGAGVGLGPNALRAMDMIDSRFRELYEDISTGNLGGLREHVMMDVSLAETGLGANRGLEPFPCGAEIYIRTSAHRKALLDIMTSLIPISTVKFNKRVKSFEQKSDRVVLTFEDGEVVETSAVIGCDGAKGATRPAVLSEKYPKNVEATYSGKYVYRSIVPMQDALDLIGYHAGHGNIFMGEKCNISAYPISKGKEFNVIAFKLDSKPWTHEKWTNLVSRETMINDFEEAGVDHRLIKLLDWATPLQWSIHHHRNTPIYYNGLICLMGDAAHATTPHQAAGAGQCLEDALVLSRLLGMANKVGDLPTAFKIYDEIRRPRANKVVETSFELGKIYTLSHPELGMDWKKIEKNLNERFLWIWEHDLEADIRNAQQQFVELT